MRAMHVLGAVVEASGGPSRSVPLQMMALLRAGVECDLVAQSVPGALTHEARMLPRSGARIIRVNQFSLSGGLLPFSGQTVTLMRLFADYDLVHIHGIWLPICHAAVTAAREVGKPVVVAPRGMLEPWALGHKWLKKRIAWVAYQRRDLAGAALLQATAQSEAQEIRRLGIRTPVAIVPNGMALPPILSKRRTSRGRRILFLSRIHPKKGLENLLNAVAANRGLLNARGWKLVVAGYDEGGYVKHLEEIRHRLGLEPLVTFRGPVEGAAKWRLYRASDLFVLPSYSENFGMVVAEALACGLPVITTRGTPWSELQKYGCGWWVPVGVKPLAVALGRALVLPRSTLAKMGARGRQLVKRRYSWDILGQRMRDAYGWVLHGGPKPSCVQVVR